MKHLNHLHEDVAADLMKMSGKKGKKAMNKESGRIDLAGKAMSMPVLAKGPRYPDVHIEKIVAGLDKIGAVKTVSAKVKVRSVSAHERGGSTSLDVLSLRVEDDNGE